MAEQVKTMVMPEFRIAFPYLFEPRSRNGKESYEFAALYTKANPNALKGLQAFVMEHVHAKWGANIPRNLNWPWTDGDQSSQDNFSGHVVINCKSYHAPGLVDEMCQPIIDRQKIYAGCWCRANINVYCYDSRDGGKPGVQLQFNAVQKVRDDDPFRASNNAIAQTIFTPVAGAGEDPSAYNPAAMGMPAQQHYAPQQAMPAQQQYAPQQGMPAQQQYAPQQGMPMQGMPMQGGGYTVNPGDMPF